LGRRFAISIAISKSVSPIRCKPFRIAAELGPALVDTGEEKLYFRDTVLAPSEEAAQNKALAEYIEAYPKDIIAVYAKEDVKNRRLDQ
jgi:hypothetical protein